MHISEQEDSTVIKIRVQPRASRNKIAGVMGDALKVTLTAPPVDGAANAACIAFFSSLFGVPKNRVEILSGHTGRTKMIKLYGLTAAEVREKLT